MQCRVTGMQDATVCFSGCGAGPPITIFTNSRHARPINFLAWMQSRGMAERSLKATLSKLKYEAPELTEMTIHQRTRVWRIDSLSGI